ncbi:MAG: cysteine desulfurase family protein [Rhodothermus sp.]|nr:cysteine desulfurase family protein [Rhodothermus sp.]
MRQPTVIYLDHAATTPLDPRVLEAMRPYLEEHYGNPSSVHQLGRRARVAIEESRERIASLIGAEPSEIIFTSGGTEADNLALRGVLHGTRQLLITSRAEHEAILRTAEALEAEGCPVTYLQPGPDGTVTAEQVANALTKETGLVSIMHTNNELGTCSPVRAIAAVCHRQGVPLHCDAVQAVGLLPVRVDELEVDLLSASAHKFYGPKGVGFLYVRRGIELRPLLWGGKQEQGRRAGTENVAAIVGMARALELAVEEQATRLRHLQQLRARLIRRLDEALGDTFVLNTPRDPERAAPHIVNIAFPPQNGEPIDGEMLLLNLDLEGVCVSSGSACTSGAVEPSHVLRAIGLPSETAGAAVRFSMGWKNTEAEIDRAVEILASIVTRMVRMGILR